MSAFTTKSGLPLVVCIATCHYVCAQDCTFYLWPNHTGPSYDLDIGEHVDLAITSYDPSWVIHSPWAELKIERLSNFPQNYPFCFMRSNATVVELPGNDDYRLQSVRVSCIAACYTEDCMPQPRAWIPLDKSSAINWADGNQPLGTPDIGDIVIVLRRFYAWDNSEALGCPHGPWSQINRTCRPEALLLDHPEYADMMSIFYGSTFDADYPYIGSWEHIPGTVYSAGNGCWLGDDPANEWLDGPWGCMYSNVVLFNWDATTEDAISLIFFEADPGNEDFLGGKIMYRNQLGERFIRLTHFGWCVVKTIEWEGPEFNIESSDWYWMNDWDGAWFDPDHPSQFPTGPLHSSPYDPFASMSLPGFENAPGVSSTPGSSIGLLGRHFPAGLLDEPHLYRAPCRPVIFGQ